MSLTSELLSAHADQWRAMTNHEFIRRVADGSVPREQFRAWLAQDHNYVAGLINYIGLLIAKAPPALTNPLGQAVVVLNDELDMFRREAEALGVDIRAEPLPACYHYLQFLTAVGYSRPFLPGLVVLWALEKAYLDSWMVARNSPNTTAEHSHFVEQWTKPPFAAWVDFLAAQVDALAAHADSGELDQARELFLATLRYEWLFWQMAIDQAGWPV